MQGGPTKFLKLSDFSGQKNLILVEHEPSAVRLGAELDLPAINQGIS